MGQGGQRNPSHLVQGPPPDERRGDRPFALPRGCDRRHGGSQRLPSAVRRRRREAASGFQGADGGFEAGNYDIRYENGEMYVSSASSTNIAALRPCASQPSQRPAQTCAIQQLATAAIERPARAPALTMTADFIRMP